MLNKLADSRFGRLKWPSFIFIFVIIYAAGYLLNLLWAESFYYIGFSLPLILRGQVWRLFTFILFPSQSNPFLVLLMCFIYFSLGRALEAWIGRFKLNFFLVLGWFFLVLAGCTHYIFFGPVFETSGIPVPLSCSYLYGILFVLFALLNPDARFLLFFFIPIRGRWLVFITLALYAIDVIASFLQSGVTIAWLIVFMILASIFTLVVFLLLNGQKVRIRKTKTQKQYNNTVHMRAGSKNREQEGAVTYRHKCCVCGRTNVTNPELDFRFCSKCIGPYEYCNEHLYTHIHKRPEGT